MNEVLYLPHHAIRSAEERTVDACLAIADESGLQAHIRHLPADEPNTVKLSVQLTPPLLEPFERVAWRRTYHWGAQYWRLPAALIGTRFTYRKEEYEFVGATLRTTIPNGFFIALRKSDGWQMRMTESFLRQTVLPAMPGGPKLYGLFSIGLGKNERIFTPNEIIR